MTTEQYTPISLHPDDMVAGGAFPLGNQLVQKSRFDHWTYPNNGRVTFALIWSLLADDGTVSEQAFSAGDHTKWAPSAATGPGVDDQGRYAIPTTGETGLNQNTNCAFLMKEVVNAGFPEDVVRRGDATLFDGLYAVFEAKAQPKRTGGTIEQRENAQSPVPVQIINLPWEPSRRGAAPAPTAIATAVAPPAPVAVTVAAPAPAAPAANSQAAAPAPGPAVAPAPAPAGSPAPAPVGAPVGGPDMPTLNKVCLDAVNAVLVKDNPALLAAVGAQVMQAHGTDPQVNAYANHVFSPEFATHCQSQGIGTDNGQFSKAA